MREMRAIVITRFGEPEVLREERLPIPEATPGTVVVRVRAFGLNHAEAYFRKGVWGEVAKVSGIECVGEVHDPGSSKLRSRERVFALMGGMGRTIDGSYAEYVRVPESNVVPFESSMEWTDLAAIPESYATAWTFLRHNLETASGQTIVIRGGTSALGQAAINIARDLDARVLATTRSRDKTRILEELGAEPLIESADLSREVRRRVPAGVDGVIDIIGTSTLLDSLKMARYRGRVAMAGFLGGGAHSRSIPCRSCRVAGTSASSTALSGGSRGGIVLPRALHAAETTSRSPSHRAEDPRSPRLHACTRAWHPHPARAHQPVRALQAEHRLDGAAAPHPALPARSRRRRTGRVGPRARAAARLQSSLECRQVWPRGNAHHGRAQGPRRPGRAGRAQPGRVHSSRDGASIVRALRAR